jgi:hypothetical protein
MYRAYALLTIFVCGSACTAPGEIDAGDPENRPGEIGSEPEAPFWWTANLIEGSLELRVEVPDDDDSHRLFPLEAFVFLSKQDQGSWQMIGAVLRLEEAGSVLCAGAHERSCLHAWNREVADDIVWASGVALYSTASF